MRIGSRDAISPILATIILIAITIAGGLLVYNTFFSASATAGKAAQIQITSASIVHSSSGADVLALDIKNTGTQPLDESTFALLIDGAQHPVSKSGTLQPGDSMAMTIDIGAVQVVQDNEAHPNCVAVSTYSLQFVNNVQSGGVIAVGAWAYGTTAPDVVFSDSAGNSYSVVAQAQAGGLTAAVGYALVASGGGTRITVKVTSNGGGVGLCSMQEYEVGGLGASPTIAGYSTMVGGTGASVSTSSTVSFVGPYFAFSICGGSGAACTISGATQGFTAYPLGGGNNGEYSTDGASSPTSFAATTNAPPTSDYAGMILSGYSVGQTVSLSVSMSGASSAATAQTSVVISG